MYQLNPTGKKYLKGLHIFLVCAWIGAGISMVLISFAKGRAANGDELYAMNATLKLIDDFVIIPAAIGTFLSGLLFALFTNWGFLRFNWIIFKWIITIAQILFGTFFLGPWVNGSVAITYAERIHALQNQTYLYYSTMNQYFGAFQVFLLIVVVFISVIKPWGARKKTRA